jgi:hypothetical protein
VNFCPLLAPILQSFQGKQTEPLLQTPSWPGLSRPSTLFVIARLCLASLKPSYGFAQARRAFQ